ncbi:MAG: hypothetical protein KGI69_00715 [Patescibacteria group bacterium]|nr:hypothetical protein [Patescibacteria group bacterium]
MKKVIITFDKQLQKQLATDEEFKQIPVLRYALAITNFIVELSATGIVPPPQFPILNSDSDVPEAVRLTESGLKMFVAAYKLAGRIEVHIQPSIVAVCLIVEVLFCSKGRGNSPILVIKAGADSMAIRKFLVHRPTAFAELQQLYDKGCEERKERAIKEAHIRSLARIGP